MSDDFDPLDLFAVNGVVLPDQKAPERLRPAMQRKPVPEAPAPTGPSATIIRFPIRIWGPPSWIERVPKAALAMIDQSPKQRARTLAAVSRIVRRGLVDRGATTAEIDAQLAFFEGSVRELIDIWDARGSGFAGPSGDLSARVVRAPTSRQSDRKSEAFGPVSEPAFGVGTECKPS